MYKGEGEGVACGHVADRCAHDLEEEVEVRGGHVDLRVCVCVCDWYLMTGIRAQRAMLRLCVCVCVTDV